MAINLKSPRFYLNRELSWLKFNERVLEEAQNQNNPLLERLKFLSIFSSNLDEFFMIRVAGLKEQIHAGIHEVAADGMPPQEQLSRISESLHETVSLQSRILMEDVLPKLRNHGIRIRHYSTLNASQQEQMEEYFREKIFPVLTPLAVDPAHPFPQLRNLGLNLLAELHNPEKPEELKVAVVPLPALLERFIKLPGRNQHDYILLEELIVEHLDLLFTGMSIRSAIPFRVTRNADLDLSEAEADDLLKLIERELRKRRVGTVIRLEISDKASPERRRFLQKITGLRESDIYDISGYLDIASFLRLHETDEPELKDPPFTPALREEITREDSIFEAIARQDILLHHPYDSFNHVIDLIQEAAKDPDVLAIKQTLYRTSGKSAIVQALKDAAANGKQVTALVELKARFDEATNIVWARELERAGVNVIYGLLGLKTHCKILMIVRQEGDRIRRYLHLGTGNYNARTARIYTDFGLLTCDEEMGQDASELFNYLTGYSRQEEWRKLWVAPVNMRESLIRSIQSCIKAHSPESPSSMRLVMNQLVDPEMIQWLYKASIKGVKVELMVRGVCALRPGIPEVSENIHVRSIVGRFLQHSRCYFFNAGGDERIYMGSADMMQRNLNRRVEILFPIENGAIRERFKLILKAIFNDNMKARVLDAEGNYTLLQPGKGEEPLNVQEYLLSKAHERQQRIDTIH